MLLNSQVVLKAEQEVSTYDFCGLASRHGLTPLLAASSRTRRLSHCWRE
jgi:hypothetical protein